jgi:cytochrome c oxidase subunit 2
MGDILYWPIAASSNAGRIDMVFNILNAVTVFFSLLICICIVYLAMRYRRGAKVDRSNPPHENLPIELAWTIIPALICLFIFVVATYVYLQQTKAPENAMEIYVVGKQWMWKLQHPEGKWEMNELHVPVGRPVKLSMTSEDVIHSFFVPAFRIKQDVIPGRYTTLWFQPTRVGHYHLFCAEYCGTKHSGMVGTVIVQEPADYERWLHEGNTPPSMAAQGEHLFRQLGCGGCHGPGSSVRAPLLEGVYGKPVAIEIPGRGNTVIQADDRYIHDSILLPEQEIAAGYKPIMPTFRGKVTEAEVLQLIAYVRSLSTSNGGSNGSAGTSTTTGNGSTNQQTDNVPLAETRSTNPSDNIPLGQQGGNPVGNGGEEPLRNRP